MNSFNVSFSVLIILLIWARLLSGKRRAACSSCGIVAEHVSRYMGVNFAALLGRRSP